MPGGQGTSWAADDLVLKPDGGVVAAWLGPVLSTLALRDVRVAEPVPSRDGHWSHDGWSATRRVDGAEPDHARTTTWGKIVEAGRALHRAVAHLPRPPFLDARTDAWARADRAAWGELRLDLPPEFTGAAHRLRSALQPLGAAQVVHADLTTNVLLRPGTAPAVIDFSPYWRPPQYAEGVVLADALCWHGAPGRLLDELGVPVPAVARALLFRMMTSELLARSAPGLDIRSEARAYLRAAEAIGL